MYIFYIISPKSENEMFRANVLEKNAFYILFFSPLPDTRALYVEKYGRGR
jgi:hypothetical protein